MGITRWLKKTDTAKRRTGNRASQHLFKQSILNLTGNRPSNSRNIPAAGLGFGSVSIHRLSCAAGVDSIVFEDGNVTVIGNVLRLDDGTQVSIEGVGFRWLADEFGERESIPVVDNENDFRELG